jgi:hypothetical protein
MRSSRLPCRSEQLVPKSSDPTARPVAVCLAIRSSHWRSSVLKALSTSRSFNHFWWRSRNSSRWGAKPRIAASRTRFTRSVSGSHPRLFALSTSIALARAPQLGGRSGNLRPGQRIARLPQVLDSVRGRVPALSICNTVGSSLWFADPSAKILDFGLRLVHRRGIEASKEHFVEGAGRQSVRCVADFEDAPSQVCLRRRRDGLRCKLIDRGLDGWSDGPAATPKAVFAASICTSGSQTSSQ